MVPFENTDYVQCRWWFSTLVYSRQFSISMSKLRNAMLQQWTGAATDKFVLWGRVQRDSTTVAVWLCTNGLLILLFNMVQCYKVIQTFQTKYYGMEHGYGSGSFVTSSTCLLLHFHFTLSDLGSSCSPYINTMYTLVQILHNMSV